MGDNPFRDSRLNPFAGTSYSFDSGTSSTSARPPNNDFSVRSTANNQSSFQRADSPNDDAAYNDEHPPQSREDSFSYPSNSNAIPLSSIPPSSNAYRGPNSADGSYTSPNRLTTSASGGGLNQRRPSAGISEVGSYMSNGNAGRKAASIRSAGTGTMGGARSFISMRSTGTSNRKAFISTRLKGEIYKPWLENPDPAQKWARWIIIGSVIAGFAIVGIMCWDGWRTTPHIGKLCLVMEDNFDTLDTNNWQREVNIGGFGNGEFDWTTDDDANTFVEDNTLYLVPTLTTDVLTNDQIISGYTVNLTSTCTASNTTGPHCIRTSNSTTGTILPPVRSARLTTKLSHNIRYGKIEFEARMPTGDWLWPAVWMLPTENYYGAWPISGEIDILEGRGNAASYAFRGLNYITSSLHWGPSKDLDRYYWTWGWIEQRRRYYNSGYRKYGLEWTDKYLWTYVDSRINQMVALDFKKENFFKRGNFPSVVANGSEQITLVNPWLKSYNNSAPFDRSFYLIMNVAVGGTNGWFPDGVGDKPWVDSASTAVNDFYNATAKWSATWPTDPKERGMAIKNLKMWQSC